MRYSKEKVNRSGRLLADDLRLITEGQGEAHRHPSIEEAVEIVEWWRREHARPLSIVAANLRDYAAEEGTPVVAQRLKKLPTIASKLLREPKMKLARMGDIGGVRAVVPDQAAAFRIAGRLRRNWTITRVHDYVTHPKADGYRALHLINRYRGRSIEVQLRTPRQDRWANAVETFARTVAPDLKYGGGPPALRAYFITLGEALAVRDEEQPVDPALLSRLGELAAQALKSLSESNEP